MPKILCKLSGFPSQPHTYVGYDPSHLIYSESGIGDTESVQSSGEMPSASGKADASTETVENREISTQTSKARDTV